MRALLPAVIVLVAACNDPPGLTLEVIPLDPSIERVEVFLADHCQGCPDAMQPPMLRAHAADMFETDYPDVFSASKSEPDKWKNGHAFFRVTSNDGMDGYVTYMMLVGFDANGTPKAINRFGGVMVPGAGSEYWKVELDENVVELTDPAPAAESIKIWGTKGPRCVLLVDSNGTATGIVPKDDPDCDGQLQHECAPFIPNAVRVLPDIDHASCVQFAPAAANIGTTELCLLGGAPCTDGMVASGCQPLDIDYCVPKQACITCAGMDWDTCVKLKLNNPDTTTGVPFANCTFGMNTDGTECSDQSKRETVMDLSGLLLFANGTKCTDIKIHDMSVPLGPFVSKIVVGGATLELGNFQDPCKIEVKWTGDFMRGSAQTLVLDVALDNGKHMAFPVLVHGNDCSLGTSCKLITPDQNEPMLQCARPTVDTTTCTPSTNTCATGGGVVCGARCCALGETCTDGVCHCGAGPACADATCVSTSPNPQPGACGDVCCDSGPGTPACM